MTARENINILEISELKWMVMGEFNLDNHCIYHCRQELLGRNGIDFIVNRRVQNAVLWCNLKNDRMISVRFQGKPFSITVIHVCPLTTDAKEVEVDHFYEDLQVVTELAPKKRCPFHLRGLECKSRKSRDTRITSKFGLAVQNETGKG